MTRLEQIEIVQRSGDENAFWTQVRTEDLRLLIVTAKAAKYALECWAHPESARALRDALSPLINNKPN